MSIEALANLGALLAILATAIIGVFKGGRYAGRLEGKIDTLNENTGKVEIALATHIDEENNRFGRIEAQFREVG